jgi:hypothetical protein
MREPTDSEPLYPQSWSDEILRRLENKKDQWIILPIRHEALNESWNSRSEFLLLQLCGTRRRVPNEVGEADALVKGGVIFPASREILENTALNQA